MDECKPLATGRAPPEWGAFKFKLGSEGRRCNPGHRIVELSVNLRTFFFRMPYGDQGLIVRNSAFRQGASKRVTPANSSTRVLNRVS